MVSFCCSVKTEPPAFGGGFGTSCLAQDGGINGQLLVDVDEVGVLDVIPLADLLHGDTEANRDAGEDVAADDGVNDVLALVHIGALRILLPGAVAAGTIAQFFFIECHFSFLLFKFVFVFWSFLLSRVHCSTATVTQVSYRRKKSHRFIFLYDIFCFSFCFLRL